MSQEQKEFVERVLRRFPQISDNPVENHLECFIGDIGEKFKQGWDYSDVVAYVKTFEEASPDLEEDVALTRRARIEAKYINGDVELHEIRFVSLADKT